MRKPEVYAPCSRRDLQLEQVEAPGRKVEIETAADEFVAAAPVASRAELVDQVVRAASQLGHGQPDVALRLIRLQVDDCHQVFAALALPQGRDEAVPSPVALPCFGRREQTPIAVA